MKKLSVKKIPSAWLAWSVSAPAPLHSTRSLIPPTAAFRLLPREPGPKPNVCIQCGKCMKTCEHDAITQNPKTGVYMINKKNCIGCGKCVEVCPTKVMVHKPENPVSKCIACGICVKACPMEVLEIVEK